MKFDSLLGGEILLFALQLCGQIKQAQLLFFFRDHFVEKCQMVAKEQDCAGIVYFGVLADIVLEENGRHRSYVFEHYVRSDEHTSELQSPYVISYAVFC